MFRNFEYKFSERNGRLIFVPTEDTRIFGERLHKEILILWTPPEYFYHFQDGGHIAAAKIHLNSQFFVHLDLRRFYDTLTRSKIHRSLRSIGYKQHAAWQIACNSTVSKNPTGRPFSLPFGFVQSPVLSCLALSFSALGKEFLRIHGIPIILSVFMDDIILSGDDEDELMLVKESLYLAASISGFHFNSAKSHGPVSKIEVFNLSISHHSLAITSSRMTEFEASLKIANSATREGILGYVGTVNVDQRAELAAL